MAKKKVNDGKTNAVANVTDYRHENATRVNIPPAKIAAEGTIPRVQEAQYSYSPRRPPSLRFDPTGKTDEILDLLEAARHRALTDGETKALAEALRTHEPWLEWAGKREAKAFEDEQTRAKHEAAKRWVTVINNWGQLGQWMFHVCKNPLMLDKELTFRTHGI